MVTRKRRFDYEARSTHPTTFITHSSLAPPTSRTLTQPPNSALITLITPARAPPSPPLAKKVGRGAAMGNALAGRRRAAKVMTVDGATFRYKTPAVAGAALRGHPGHQILESEEVRRFGVRARPLERDAPLKPGKLYFLVQIPLGGVGDDPRAPRKTWSGALHVGARERLESLMLSRRTVSDVAAVMPSAAARATGESPRPSSVEVGVDGAVRLRMRLPKAEVARLMKESKDAAEAAEKIMQLCVARDQGTAPAPATGAPVSALSSKKTATKKEKRTRFVTVPDEIIG